MSRRDFDLWRGRVAALAFVLILLANAGGCFGA
jgi:hypothetical protein